MLDPDIARMLQAMQDNGDPRCSTTPPRTKLAAAASTCGPATTRLC